MGKKSSVEYICQSCGSHAARWAGRCFVCGEWNTMVEQLAESEDIVVSGTKLPAKSITDASYQSPKHRLKTSFDEVDTVLGGGFVGGSVSLLAGQPGIGKSTFLLQIADAVAKNHDVLYISGEESSQQVSLRAKRLGVDSKKLQLTTSSSADDIASTIASREFQLVIVDSIQTVSVKGLSSAAGTVSQISNSAQVIIEAGKRSGVAVVLVGHVTKEGSIAGPKLLEHVVDVVLQLEGDQYGGFKVLRGSKNRYGSTNETGIFEMTDRGLQAVKNPSAALLAERQVSDGSIVLATMEGTRPLLVEVQALVNRTSYGYPKRTASGVDLNRVNLLVAVLERRTKLNLADQDIYINIVGGLRVTEPAADLAICMAVASASKGLQLKQNVVVFGEVGLSGEIRHVPFVDKRLVEAKKIGFSGALGPLIRTGKKPAGLHGVGDIRSALNQFLEKE